MIDYTAVVAIVGAFVSIFALLINLRKQRQDESSFLLSQYRTRVEELEAEFDEMRAETRAEMEQFKTRISELEATIEEKDSAIEELLEGIRILLEQMRERNIRPNWRPRYGDGADPRASRRSLRPPRS